MKNRKNPAMFGASVAISAVATAGAGWTDVLFGWIIGGILLLILPAGRRVGKFCGGLTLVLGAVVLTGAVMGAEEAFPQDSTFPFVSAAVLILAWRAVLGEKRTPVAAANVLGLILLPILIAMVLFGLKDVSWRENVPEMSRMSAVLMALTATCPWWGLREGDMGRRGWCWFGGAGILSVGMSLLCRGVLGRALAAAEPFPPYRAVQAIHVLGILQRMEALLAVTVLLGMCALVFLVTAAIKEAGEALCPEREKPVLAIILIAVFLTETALRLGWVVVLKELKPIFWAGIPAATLGIVVLRKVQSFGQNERKKSKNIEKSS